jgi:hypothetical protein
MKAPPCILNDNRTASEKTQDALRSMADPKPAERVDTNPTRCVTNVYEGGVQGKF